ncbi:MAG: hypothetical protein DMF45_08620 [Verrucomicrobia bacterium]|nr:MAG: hypothetical protein DMF45_08620 [Verrucomicrobiota bacterium]
MMKQKPFRGLGAILFKEFIVVWRDPMTLFFMFFPPLVEMIAFGYALDTDVKHMALVILNEDRTVESRQFIDRFVNTETFRVVGEVQSIEEMSSQIRKGRAYAGLQIPPKFTQNVRAGYPAQVQLLVDGSNSTTALQALNTALSVALTQSIESLLVSPLSRWGLMLGKLVPYLCIGMLMAMLLFSIMRFLFAVPIAGNILALLVSTLVYCFALLSIGLFVGTKAENQMQALQMSMMFVLPSVFFSGFIFPRETMPWIFYALGAILPTTYFISLARAIILRGAHFFEYWPHLLVLIIMSILLFAFCALAFRKKIG